MGQIHRKGNMGNISLENECLSGLIDILTDIKKKHFIDYMDYQILINHITCMIYPDFEGNDIHVNINVLLKMLIKKFKMIIFYHHKPYRKSYILYLDIHDDYLPAQVLIPESIFNEIEGGLVFKKII